MRRYFVFALSFLLSFYSFASANDISIELTPKFTDDKFPEGGHPMNEAHTNAFSFTVSMSGTPTSYASGGETITASYTVSVSLPTPTPVSFPVWSDIPDPYNLTVGDSFYLDLRNYVTGSPTITRNGGILPAGLSFSNGVLSGTVSSVESRGIRFTATNSAGAANSDWIEIYITR